MGRPQIFRTSEDRILGAVLGHAVGDALGVPVEFGPRAARRADPVIEMRGYGTHHQPPGSWSDDTSLMLCLVETLTEHPSLGDKAFQSLAGKFIAWRDEGYWTPHGEAFDIGGTTSQAISRLRAGTPPLEAGGADERSNGNGSLMRILPLAFLPNLDDTALARTAEDFSRLTHRHYRSKMACGLFVLLCRRLLEGLAPDQAYLEAITLGRRLYSRPPFESQLPHYERFLSGRLTDLPEEHIRSTGYVVHTLEASVWCLLHTNSFAAAVLRAVNLGDDTDTTAAVTGGLAGAVYGLGDIPKQWTETLVLKEQITGLASKYLLKARGLFADETKN